uniref:Uncharacterized protein n=1 Tax=Arundo donax TaxID=35708 RepID=A0A0A8XXD7_ARUDO
MIFKDEPRERTHFYTRLCYSRDSAFTRTTTFSMLQLHIKNNPLKFMDQLSAN